MPLGGAGKRAEGLRDRRAEQAAGCRFDHAVDSDEGDAEGEDIFSAGKALNKIGVVKKDTERGHKKQGVEQRTRKAGRGKDAEAAAEETAQKQKQDTGQKAHQNPRDHAGDQGADRVDPHQGGAERFEAEALDDARDPEYRSEDCSGGGPEDDGADDHGDRQKGNAQEPGAEVSERGKGHHHDDGCEQGDPDKETGAGMAFMGLRHAFSLLAAAPGRPGCSANFIRSARAGRWEDGKRAAESPAGSAVFAVDGEQT